MLILGTIVKTLRTIWFLCSCPSCPSPGSPGGWGRLGRGPGRWRPGLAGPHPGSLAVEDTEPLVPREELQVDPNLVWHLLPVKPTTQEPNQHTGPTAS